MMQRIQALPRWGRIAVFSALVLLVVAFFGGMTMLALVWTATSTPRTQAIALLPDELQVREFAILPDEDSYPPALALAPNGDLFTGSYATGTIWRITPDGDVSEVINTREIIGSVTGLDVASDGSLYVLDRLHPLVALGGVVWRITPQGAIEEVLRLPEHTDRGTRLPDDIAVDSMGNVYISDRSTDEVLRLSPDGEVISWWLSPRMEGITAYAPTGLAYNPANDSLIITDSFLDTIYQVPVSASNTRTETQILYQHGGREYAGFDGVSIAPNGDVYVAGLALNRVARIPADAERDQAPDYLAGAFRGSVDVAYDAERRRLYVANWDQRSLVPVDIIFFQIYIDPHLPFAIDVITFE